MERWLVLILICVSFSLGCSRQVEQGGRSVITIRVPSAKNTFNKSGGVGAMSAMPSDRKACYGINVTGPGIQGPSNMCHPSAGIMAGFVEPGVEVSVEVPKGPNRTIELVAYLQNTGDNLPCPGYSPNMPPARLAATYKVGSAVTDVTGPTTEVTITADFPGLANTVASQLSLPASCTVAATPTNNTPGFDVLSGGGFANAGTINLSARIGAVKPGSEATNGTIVLKRK